MKKRGLKRHMLCALAIISLIGAAKLCINNTYKDMVSNVIRESYEDSQVEIKTVAEYDTMLKDAFTTSGYNVEDYEFTLLKRDFVNKVGYDTLISTMASNSDVRIATEWLLGDIDNLRLYIYGGAPDGTYINSLRVLGKLLNEYGSDLQAEGVTNGNQYKDIFRKMMISLSLTHANGRVTFWLPGTGTPAANVSDANIRYGVFREMFYANKLNNRIFSQLEVEEMRFVMGSHISDDEIAWLQNYTKNVKKTTNVFYLMNYIKDVNTYRDPKYYVGSSTYNSYLNKYSLNGWGVKSVPYYPRVWIVLDAGGVCWQISNVGQNIQTSYGIPCFLFGQPRHMAFVIYSLENGKGVWTINNDMFGWAQSQNNAYDATRSYYRQRMIAGWGSASWSDGSKNASYLLLGQAAINDYNEYVKAEELITLSQLYTNTSPATKEALLREALNVQSINLDAWAYLVELYVKDTTKTEQDYIALSTELAEALKYYPVPALDLLKFIEGRKISSNNAKATMANLKNYVLTSAQTVPNGTVLQANVVRMIANALLGTVDTRVATFSAETRKLALTSRYEGSEMAWDYSLDGGNTWNLVVGSSVTLTEEQMDYMADTWGMYGIKVHIIGSEYDSANIYNIDIAVGIINIKLFYGNDRENRIMSASGNAFYNLCEWRIKGENTEWTRITKQLPDLSGNKVLELRTAAYDNENASVTSSMIYEFTFTDDGDTPKRTYIPIRHLSVSSCSSQAGTAGRVVDGFINDDDYWKSNNEKNSFIVIKVNELTHISAIEYFPVTKGTTGNLINGKVYVSENGTDWTLATTVSNLANDNTPKMIEFEDSIKGQYVKVEWDHGGANNCASASMINVFQDTTKPLTNHATAITLNKKSTQITLGETENLVATVTPADTADEVTWTSSNTDVLNVTEDGQILTVGTGVAEVTATVNGLSATCTVEVICNHEQLEYQASTHSTCVDKGNIEYFKCSNCGKLFEDEDKQIPTTLEAVLLPLEEHTWDNGVVTLEPTPTTTGKKLFTCIVCDATKEETLEKVKYNVSFNGHGHIDIYDTETATTPDRENVKETNPTNPITGESDSLGNGVVIFRVTAFEEYNFVDLTLEGDYGELVDLGDGKYKITQVRGDISVNINTRQKFQKGDLSQDTYINSTDAALVLDLFKNGNATIRDYELGDMNLDNQLNASDAAMILDIFKSTI